MNFEFFRNRSNNMKKNYFYLIISGNNGQKKRGEGTVDTRDLFRMVWGGNLHLSLVD